MSRDRVPGMRARRERLLFVIPSPATPGLSAPERLTLSLRMDATITGCCACGATLPRIRVRRGKAVQHVAMEHEPDCPAADGPYLAALLRRLGERLEYEAIAVEVEVAA